MDEFFFLAHRTGILFALICPVTGVSSKYCMTIGLVAWPLKYKDLYGEETIVSVTYEYEKGTFNLT